MVGDSLTLESTRGSRSGEGQMRCCTNADDCLTLEPNEIKLRKVIGDGMHTPDTLFLQ